MRKENSPLRTILNGQLLSVPETFYDFFILREIDAQRNEFPEAAVAGNMLGKYRLGIGDAWVALRIEEFVQDGLLEAVTMASPGDPVYHRILHKRHEL